jgi:hypothetical protein
MRGKGGCITSYYLLQHIYLLPLSTYIFVTSFNMYISIPITSFNIHISHVKKIQNEERGTSPFFFFWEIFCYEVFAKKRKYVSLSTTGVGCGVPGLGCRV